MSTFDVSQIPAGTLCDLCESAAFDPKSSAQEGIPICASCYKEVAQPQEGLGTPPPVEESSPTPTPEPIQAPKETKTMIAGLEVERRPLRALVEDVVPTTPNAPPPPPAPKQENKVVFDNTPVSVDDIVLVQSDHATLHGQPVRVTGLGLHEGQTYYSVMTAAGLTESFWAREVQKIKVEGEAAPVPNTQGRLCQACGCGVTELVKLYSIRHFNGQVLCQPCQQKGATANTAQVKNPGVNGLLLLGFAASTGVQAAREVVYQRLDQIHKKWGNFTLVHGCTPSDVENAARAWAKERNMGVIPSPPKEYSPAALLERNSVMATQIHALLMFWDGSLDNVLDLAVKTGRQRDANGRPKIVLDPMSFDGSRVAFEIEDYGGVSQTSNQQGSGGYANDEEDCRRCNGTGQRGGGDCFRCGGEGRGTTQQWRDYIARNRR